MAKVAAMFNATPPGKRVMRPGTSPPKAKGTCVRPMMSHRTEPMQRMSGVMERIFAGFGGKAQEEASQPPAGIFGQA